MSAPTIPVLDASELEAGGPAVDEALLRAFGELGILHLAGHGLDPAALDALYDTFGAFCALPREAKERTNRPDLWWQRGWTPPNTEVALAGGGRPDFKECWFACCTPQAARDRELFPEIHAESVWPEELPRFREDTAAVALGLQGIAQRVLGAAERALGLRAGELLRRIDGGPHVTRLLHYLPLGAAELDAGLPWGENHTDFCALTLLPGGRFLDADGAGIDAPRAGGGLFQTTRSGETVAATPPPGCLVVQVGQQLEVLTGGTFLATPHEVRAPRSPGLARLSCAHFVHLRADERVFPLEPFRSPEAVRRYRPPVLAGTYDLKVLVDIGLAPPDALERLGYANQERIVSSGEKE